MEFEIEASDGTAVRVQSEDWMTALIRGADALGTVPTEFSCHRQSPQLVRVEDRRSGLCWMVRALEVEPEPPATFSGRFPVSTPKPAAGRLMSPTRRLWRSLRTRPLWSPHSTPRVDTTPDGHGFRRPLNLTDSLLERSMDIGAAQTAVEAAQVCLRFASAWAKAEAGSVLLVDGDERLVFWAVHGGAGDLLLGQPIPRGSGLAWAAADSGVSLVIDDVASDPRHYDETDRETGFDTRSLLAVPLRSDEQLYGVLELINAQVPQGFLAWQVDAVESLASALTRTLAGEA